MHSQAIIGCAFLCSKAHRPMHNHLPQILRCNLQYASIAALRLVFGTAACTCDDEPFSHNKKMANKNKKSFDYILYNQIKFPKQRLFSNKNLKKCIDKSYDL